MLAVTSALTPARRTDSAWSGPISPSKATTSGATNNSDANGASADLDNAFIQVSNNFGTYTAGRTGSFFDFWGSDGPGDIVLIDDNTQGSTNLFGFTFAGGNGFSFTLAAEDPMSNGRRFNSP